MNFELFNLIELANSCLTQPVSADDKEPDQDTEFNIECNRVLISIHSCISNAEPVIARAYFLQHQVGLLNILRKIDEQLPSLDGTNPNVNLAQKYQLSLSTLLNEMKVSYPYYFDHYLEVPPYLLTEFIDKQKIKLNKLVICMESREIPQDIVDLIMEIYNMESTGTAFPSFYTLDYLKKTLAIILAMISKDTHFDSLKFVTTLLALGFNHPAFYNFSCGFIIGQAELGENISDQLHSLQFLLKKIEQVQPVITGAYDKELLSIKEALICFINAEIAFIRSLDFLSEELSSGGLIEKNYRVSFTVRQLAIFIHLQVEAGIIITEKPSVVHQYVSKHFTTPDTESISEKSFKNSYYGNSKDDLEKIIPKISQMLVLAQEKL